MKISPIGLPALLVQKMEMLRLRKSKEAANPIITPFGSAIGFII
jgi:hypothetical protein